MNTGATPMHRLTDEQIEAARGTPVRGIGAFWRNVADAAADHARDVTVREIVETLRQAAYFCSSDHIKDKYRTAFAAPTPQPPSPVKDEPALDEATVRRCMEAMRVIRRENYDVPDDLPLDPKSRITDECVCALESLLPKPAPTLPTHYVDAAESSRPCRVRSIEEVRRRHGLLTPEEAAWVAFDMLLYGSRVTHEVLIAALRLAAINKEKA